MKRILVTGSRDWSDAAAVYGALDQVVGEWGFNFPPDEYGNTMPDDRLFAVVEGGCPTGADFFADQWCIGNFFMSEKHPAKWNELGKRAGFVRNAEMVNLGADVCLAFIRNESKGATHTANLAIRAGIETRIFRE